MPKPPAVRASFAAPVFALVIALALVLGACGSVESTAVTVNGHRINQKSVDEELRQIRDNKQYRDVLGIQKVEGSGKSGTFDAEFASQVLTLRIYYELVDEELAKRNVTLTAKDLSDARKSTEQSLGVDQQTGQPLGGASDAATAGKKVLGKFSKAYQDSLVRREASVAKLQSVLSKTDTSDATLQKYYDAHKDEFTKVCAKHVLVDTKEAADKVATDLRGGADFAAEAKAQSKDPSAQQNGGDLGCVSASTYVPEFAKATLEQPLNQIGDPVQSQFGWHVILVTSREPQAFTDVRDEIRQKLSASSGNEINQWLTNALKKAKVSVNKKFGSFDRTPSSGQLPRVVPPEQPSTSTTARRTTTTGG